MTRSGNLAYDVLVNEDAVLTDPGLTAEQARAVGDWVGDRPGNRFTLEGHDLVIVETEHSADSTVLHVPDLGLVVAGDVIYNGVHMYLAQRAIVGGLGPWRAAIDTVEALRPRHIVCGHQNKELDDDAGRTIAETRQYLTTPTSC